MTSLVEFMNESYKDELKDTNVNEQNLNEAEIKDEKAFRDYAEKKFKEAFGDEYDEKKMKETVDGLLADNKDLVDDGKWGELVGMLNKSFGK